MIQGGCPFTKPGGNMALAGTGDPGYKIRLGLMIENTSGRIPCAFSPGSADVGFYLQGMHLS